MSSIRHWRLFSVMFVMLGCSSATIPLVPYAAKPVATYSHSALRHGVAVAADALTDPARCESHFGENLLEDGILPIFLVVENRGDTSVTLERQDVTIVGTKDVYSWDETRPDRSKTAYGLDVAAVAASAGSILFPPLFIIAFPALLASMKIRTDRVKLLMLLESKALEDSTLSTGESVGGFLFFDLATLPEGAQGLEVAVEVTDLQSHQKRSVKLPVGFSDGAP